MRRNSWTTGGRCPDRCSDGKDVGCPTRITYQDGRRRDYAYDDLYRLTREEHSDAQASSLLWHNYTYDEAGNRTEKLYDHAESGDKYAYAYDALNQLSTLTATGTPGDRIDVTGTVADDNLSSVVVCNNTLDPVGEFEAQLRKTFFIARAVDVEEGPNDLYALALDKSSNESRYPADPETYHTVTLAAAPDPNLDYVFDANGCLVEVIEDTTTLKEYAYDFEKRLVEVKHGGVVVARFQYDALGRRVVVKLYDNGGVLESTTRFLYDGDRVIEEHEWNGQTSSWVFAAAYIHGLGIDNVLALTHDPNGAPSTYSYYHYDGIGSVTELTDADGALAQAYEYDAWGIATIYDPTSSLNNRYLFTGREWDASIALYYYRARHYDPGLGRFLQTDPAGYGASINLYIYVGSTPTAFIDPTGLRVVDPETGELGPTPDLWAKLQEEKRLEHQQAMAEIERNEMRNPFYPIERAITRALDSAMGKAGDSINNRVWNPMGFQIWQDNESKPTLSPFLEGLEQGAWQDANGGLVNKCVNRF